MDDKIICLVGESGSGKTTIAELLEKEEYNYIQSYTTRPKRNEDERGHIFVDTVPTVLNMHGFINKDKWKYGIIAYTFFNGEHYWATREQYQGKGTSIYIIDVHGIEQLKKEVIDAEIVVIYLQCDIKNRYIRMCNSRGYEEAGKRIEHDKEAFKIVQCDYVVDANRTIKEVLKIIKKLI